MLLFTTMFYLFVVTRSVRGSRQLVFWERRSNSYHIHTYPPYHPPHARFYSNDDENNMVSIHPTFGHTDGWQQDRPSSNLYSHTCCSFGAPPHRIGSERLDDDVRSLSYSELLLEVFRFLPPIKSMNWRVPLLSTRHGILRSEECLSRMCTYSTEYNIVSHLRGGTRKSRTGPQAQTNKLRALKRGPWHHQWKSSRRSCIADWSVRIQKRNKKWEVRVRCAKTEWWEEWFNHHHHHREKEKYEHQTD